MGTDQDFVPRSRVGAVVVALLKGDEAAAGEAAERPPDEHDQAVLDAAVRLAVQSLFDADASPESVTEFVTGMTQDIELDPAVAEALIRKNSGGEDGLLAELSEEQVVDATWSLLGYLCERQLGPEDSLQLVAVAEEEALPATEPAEPVQPPEPVEPVEDPEPVRSVAETPQP
jgi:hypothetical protein